VTEIQNKPLFICFLYLFISLEKKNKLLGNALQIASQADILVQATLQVHPGQRLDLFDLLEKGDQLTLLGDRVGVDTEQQGQIGIRQFEIRPGYKMRENELQKFADQASTTAHFN
jgi:hypothetical protein